MAQRNTTVTETQDDLAPEAASFDDMVGAGADAADREFDKAAASTGLAMRGEDDELAGMAMMSKEYTNAPTLDASDMATPRLRLAQGLTAEVQNGDAKPGQWVLVGHEPVTEVNIIPLQYAKNRTFRPDPDQAPTCISGNAVRGVGDNGEGEGVHMCVSCPQAKWGEKNPKTGKGTPPACRLQYSYICYSVTHDELVELNLASTATDTAMWINRMIGTKRLGNFGVLLKSVSQQGSRGAFYKPAAAPYELSANDRERAREFMPS